MDGRARLTGKSVDSTHPLRWVYLSLGWLFFALGLLGVLLPLLPTTPFMLLALWAFSKGSSRLHDWLYQHPRFGPPLQRWRRHRVIPLHAKLFIVVTMSGSLAWLWGFSGLNEYLAVGVTGSMLLVMAWSLTRPSTAPAERD